MDVKENSERKEDIKREVLNSGEEKFMILLVLEDGEVSWIMSDSFSFDQKKVFNRVNMVLGSPSLVLRLCMAIEMILIYISLSIGSLFKFKK